MLSESGGRGRLDTGQLYWAPNSDFCTDRDVPRCVPVAPVIAITSMPEQGVYRTPLGPVDD
jgi:hypothetical protein